MNLTVKILMFGLMLCSSLSAQRPERPNRLNADGDRIGEWILWLDHEMNYRDPDNEAEWFRRHYKPCYYALVTFVDGKPKDTATIHYETGEVRWKGRMVKFDPFTPVDGKYILMHKNGVTAAEVQFVNGQREGTELWWYDTGTKEWEKPYKSGKLSGIATQWYRNGKVRTEIPFANGEINGTVRNWYESGVRESEIPYICGNREGMRIDYRESGEKRAETPLAEDEVHGIVIEFYESGVMREARSWENNRPNGMRYGYYESGVKKFEANYLDGQLHGYAKRWTEEGWLEPIRFYDHGRLVEQQ